MVKHLMLAPSSSATVFSASFRQVSLYRRVSGTTVAVLPEQFSDAPRLASRIPGVIALMRAVLWEAVGSFQKGLAGDKEQIGREAKKAQSWLFNDEEDWLFSFLNICRVLDLDPQDIRKALQRQLHDACTQLQQRRRGRMRQPSRAAA